MSALSDIDVRSNGLEEIAPTRSVDRAAKILIALGHAPPEGLGVSELGRRLSLDKGTIYRIAQTLVASQLVTYIPSSRTYQLGPRTLELGLKVLQRFPISTEAQPFLGRIRTATGQSAALYLATDHHLFAVATAISAKHPEPKRTVQMGELLPLHAGSAGKVFLAFRGPEFTRQYLDRLHKKFPQVDIESLSAAIAAAADSGYAIGIGSRYPDLNAISFPVVNGNSELLAVIVVGGDAESWTPEAMLEQVSTCQGIITKLEAILRYMPPIMV